MEVTALRAQLADLQEETLDLKNQIRKEVQEEYRELVQALFMTCLHIKEQLRPSEQDDRGTLAAVVCKVRSLGRWRLAAQQAHLRGQLSRAEKEYIHSQRECLRIKLMAEQEVGLLHQQLRAARQALAKAQTDNRKLWQQQDTQAQLLRELEHRVTQDSVTRQQLEILRTSGMEKLLEDVEQKEQQLQLLTEEAQRASKMGQLQWKKMDRDLQQMRSRLAQERSMKLDAFQRVRELQSQLDDTEQPPLQMGCPAGLTPQNHRSLNSAAALSRCSHQRFPKTNLLGNKMARRIQRPKTVPIKQKKRIDDHSLPNVQPTTLQVQTAPSRISFRTESFSSQYVADSIEELR